MLARLRLNRPPPSILACPAPRQVGVCSALTGHCTCPPGWRGFNCLHPMKRYCANSFNYHGFERERQPPNVSLGVGGPSIWMFPATHCAGARARHARLACCLLPLPPRLWSAAAAGSRHVPGA